MHLSYHFSPELPSLPHPKINLLQEAACSEVSIIGHIRSLDILGQSSSELAGTYTRGRGSAQDDGWSTPHI